MKKISKLIFASAALLAAFVSCQKVDEISEAPKTTHIVRFTTELPTKTSYVVEGTSVKYKWEEADIANLKVLEDGTAGTITGHSISENGVLSLEVSFTDSQEGAHTYTAYLNGVVKPEQVETSAGSYDPTCDVLVAKPVQSSDLGEGGVYTFQFRRPVAITELKLKNLTAGEEVSKVTIISDANNPLVGKYTQGVDDDTTGDWGETSNKIVVTFGKDGETPKTVIVENDGSLIVPIVSMPVENASVKVLVETESGLKYRKVTASALTLTENNVKVQGIGLTQISETAHEEAGWYLVTDANELFDGDEIRIACPEEGMIAGDFAIVSEETKEYLAANKATFTPETYAQITGVDSENKPNTFTLVENYGSFALVNENGKLGTTAAKNMSYDDGDGSYSGVTEWTIAIENNLATISAGDYGRILCNVNSTRFLNYKSDLTSSMLLPQIYKKYGDASDPIMKISRTASFNSEKATVTIGAEGNVFPKLSFNPEEATEGTQTWTSSNTEVATINETTGKVTLVNDGTTTISVEIAETDTYQPCSAEYVLTVKPAEVEGVDYLDRAWTGVSDGSTSYSSWTKKTGSKSGNTYAGNSAGGKNSIQLRAKDNSGIVVTATNGGKIASNVTIDWNSETTTGRSIKIFGKNTAYGSAADLYDNTKTGTELGTIGRNETTLSIDGDYEYIGIQAVGGAVYLNSISIQWENAKPEYEACFKDAGGNTVTEVNATFGSVFTAPTLYKGATPGFANAYESSNTEVATVDETGKVTLVKKGDAVITATLNGDDTHKTTKVSYTIHVANKLSSIKLADDSEQPTTFYVGQNFSFTGIKVEATYTDGEEKTLTDADLTSNNFSGFDSSAAVESQTITVSYTDGETKTTTYNVEIKPLVTLYGITVPDEDANGNSITVKGGLTEAPEGAEIELNVNRNTEKGYKLTSLKLNEVEHSGDVVEGKYTFTMPAAAVNVTAEFDNHYTVTLTQPAANGTVKVQSATTSSQSIACGETVSVLADPATGYKLDSWTVTGATLADATKESTTFTMPANDVSVTASFKVKPNETTVTFSSLGFTSWGESQSFSGTTKDKVSQSNQNVTFTYERNGSNCYANTTSIRFYQKNNLKFSVPNGCKITSIEWTGSSFKNDVTTDVGTCTSTTEALSWSGNAQSVTFTRPSNASSYAALSSVTVKYTGTPTGGDTPTTYTLTLTQVTGGTISAEVGGQSVSTGAKIDEGKTVTIKAEASTGYSFTSWALPTSGLSNSTSATTTFTMNADTEVKATFNSTGGGQGGGGETYVLCTSTSDLVAGAKYIIASGNSGDVVCISNVSNSNNRKTVAETVSDSKIDISDTQSVMTLTLGGTTGNWTLFTDNYAGTNGYLASAASGSNNHCRVISGETKCTITFSDKAAVITLNPHTSRNILRYNSSSDCFACYSSGQNAIYLYKKSN